MSKGLNILQAVGHSLSGTKPGKSGDETALDKAAAIPGKGTPRPHGGEHQPPVGEGGPDMDADHQMGQGEHFGIDELEKHIMDLHAMVKSLRGAGQGSRGEHS